jgi:ADP-ribose pyrophosphatase
MSKEEYSIISKKVVYDGPVRLRIDTFNYNGKVFRKEVVEHSPSVGIIPILNKKEILLIKQFRHAVNKYLIEIPAGKIENNESPYEAAKRELAEETGYTGVLKPLTRCFLAPSYDTELMHFFVAENVSKVDAQEKMDEDENITNFVVELNDAIKYCYDGTIIDCKTVTAIFLYYFALHSSNESKSN